MQAASGTGFLGGMLSGLMDRECEDARARRGALFAFSIRVVSAGLAFGSQILLARWMGIHDFGIITYCIVLMSVLSVLTSFGLPWASVRFLSEYGAKGEWDKFRGFLTSARIGAVWAGTVCCVVAITVVSLLGGRISDDLAAPLILVLACLPLQSLNEMQEGAGKSQGWIGLALVPAFVLRPLIMIALIGAAKLAGLETNAVTAALALLASLFIITAGQYVMQVRRFAQKVPAGPKTYEPRTWVSVAFALFFLEGFSMLLLHSDVLVLKLFVPADQISLYYAAVRTISLTSFVYFAIASAFGPRFSASCATNDREGLLDLYRKACVLTFWPSLLTAAGVLALGKPLLWLFGPEFVVGYPLMFVIAVGLLVRAAIGPMQVLLSMCGCQKHCASILLVILVFNVCLNALLIPLYGLMGTAIATMASMMLESGLLAWVARRRFDLPLIALLPARAAR
ncbi:MAG: oligosaccharide flippase family protein [Pseudomonadota bacterium]